MLKKELRFHGHGSLRYVYTKGRQDRTKQASIRYVLNKRNTNPRVAVVVSKKVTKVAPKRNRIRRRFYEAMRRRLPDIEGNYDIVITIFDERLADSPATEITQLTNELLAKASLVASRATDVI